MKSFAPLLNTKKKVSFLILDMMIFIAAISIVSAVRLGADLLLLIFAVPVIQYIFGNYDLDHIANFKKLFVRQLIALVMTLFTAGAITYIFANLREDVFGRGSLFSGLALFFLISLAYRTLVINYFKKTKGHLKWLVIADAPAQDIVRKDFADLEFEGTLQFLSPLEGPQKLREHLKSSWSTIVISLKDPAQQAALEPVIVEEKCAGVNTIAITQFYERHLRKVPVHLLDYHWFINAEGFSAINHPIQLRLKRLMDLTIAAVLLLLVLPIIAVVALLIKLESKGPAIYKQTRTGKNNKPFTIYKLRSMRTDSEKNGAQWASKNDSRVTRMGRFIRLTRLDEMPQLWNVLKGDMSFVGPRPERPEFNEMLKKELPFYDLRHSLRPGLTGWAQVLYPYGASVEDAKEKLQFELYYIKHSSLMLDSQIILKTVAVVVGARGR